MNRVICVDKTGWAAKSVYVTPNQIIDLGDGIDKYKFQSETRPDSQSSKGTLESWQQEVSALCVGNSRLMFSVSAAFAGALLEPCSFTGGGFHFVGSSSIGKSLSMLMAASVIDNPDKAIITWRATDNGLEGIAARHNDGLLMLDELGQVDGKKAGEIAYMLANGKGKARANREGAARQCATWRLIYLSNGEIDLATHMIAEGKKAKAGQEVRMVSIPADAGKGLGIFDCLPSCVSNSKAMADKVKQAAMNNYGTAYEPFVRYIAENWEYVARRGKELAADFIKLNVDNIADGQVKRAAERFGIVAAAGELATEAEITGWGEGYAKSAASVCFKAWLERRGGMGSQEERDITQRLMDVIMKEDSRFQRGHDTTINRLGFLIDNQYKLPVSCFNEIFKGFDHRLVAQVLQTQGIIKHGIGKDLPRETLVGLSKRQRCYSISTDDLPDAE